MPNAVPHAPRLRAPKQKAASNPHRANRIQAVRVLDHRQLGDLGDEVGRHGRGLGGLDGVGGAGAEAGDNAGHLLAGAPAQHQVVDIVVLAGPVHVGVVRRLDLAERAAAARGVFLVVDVVQQRAEDDDGAVEEGAAVALALGLLDRQDGEGEGDDGEDVVEVVAGVEFGGGHVGFGEEGCLPDEGVGGVFAEEGRVEGGVGWVGRGHGERAAALEGGGAEGGRGGGRCHCVSVAGGV